MTEFMSQTDAFTWGMESDPRLRSTVVTVIMLDRVPVLGKIHHGLTDGVGGVQIAMTLFDLTARPRSPKSVESGIPVPARFPTSRCSANV